MKIIAVNAGSSSLKFQVLKMPSETVIGSGVVERIGNDNAVYTLKVKDEKIVFNTSIKDHQKAVDIVLKSLIDHYVIKSFSEIEGVGHRVVQGGEIFKASALIDDQVILDIESLNELAPLHNPANVVGIKAFRAILPTAIHVAVFDTTFHTSITEDAYMYATPYDWYIKYGVRKYGAHGTSHQYVSERIAQITQNKNLKIVVCHIGNGASLCAVKDMKSVDTSMGFTPLEGIPMGTRSGNIDPAVLQFVSKKLGYSLIEDINILNKESGYLGLSGISHDSRDIEDAYKAGNKRAILTLNVQAKRIADYIGSYFVYMGGLDFICFTAGIGENSALLRSLIIKRLEGALGVKLNDEANKVRGKEVLISSSDSKIGVYIIPTNEEVMIARDVYRFSK